MITREDIVREARAWIGTPFHWQASVKGRGADCKGLVWGIARELGLPEAQSPFASIDASYRGTVDAKLLAQGLKETFRRVAEPSLGDVLLLKIGGKAQHLAILVEDGPKPRMIHTYHTSGRVNHVIDVPFQACWRSELASAWTWPSLGEAWA